VGPGTNTRLAQPLPVIPRSTVALPFKLLRFAEPLAQVALADAEIEYEPAPSPGIEYLPFASVNAVRVSEPVSFTVAPPVGPLDVVTVPEITKEPIAASFEVATSPSPVFWLQPATIARPPKQLQNAALPTPIEPPNHVTRRMDLSVDSLVPSTEHQRPGLVPAHVPGVKAGRVSVGEGRLGVQPRCKAAAPPCVAP
jgi:hypothetical protein